MVHTAPESTRPEACIPTSQRSSTTDKRAEGIPMDVVELIDWSPLSLHIATPPSQSRHNLQPQIDSGARNSGQKMEPENPTNEEYREQRKADNQEKRRKKKKRMGLTNS